MEILYQDTTRLLIQTQNQVAELSSFYHTNTGNHIGLEAKVSESLHQLEQDLNRLESLVRKQPPHLRQEAKSRADQLSADYRNLNTSVRSYYNQKEQIEQEQQAREELFSRKYTTNSSGDTAIPLDPSLTHNSQLHQAHKGLDLLLENASGVIGGLQNQYSILKKARTKMLDVANTLGLSNTVMRLIERRTTQDKWIFWTGVVITLFVIFLVLRYFL